MKTLLRISPVSILFAVTVFAGQPPVTLQQMTDTETSQISAVLVSNVLDASDSRGETEADASVLTVYTGPAIAPFTAYIKVFDPIPQNGGDYGTFKVFKVPTLLNGYPKQMKVDYSRNGKFVYVGFNATYFDSFTDNGDPKYGKGRLITKFAIASPVTEGAIAPTAEFSIRH